MAPDLLPTPASKPRCYFEKKYPFPIFNPDWTTESIDQEWRCFIGHLRSNHVEVTDDESSTLIYTMGFYGKGKFSRTPKICSPSESLLGMKRPHLEDACTSKKQKTDSVEASPNENQNEVEIVIKDETDEEIISVSDSSDSSDDSDDQSASTIPLGDRDEEPLQLTFEEAFFLSYALGCLVVKDNMQPLDILSLWNKFCELTPGQNFPVMYTAYHHFRSKGWVVRSGIKYGTDFVLYKDGPPFYHSTYAVIVKPINEKNFRDADSSGRMPFSWASLSAFLRINEHAAKTVVILYVVKPDLMSETKVSTPYCVSQYKLHEVMLQRWVPSENREVENE